LFQSTTLASGTVYPIYAEPIQKYGSLLPFSSVITTTNIACPRSPMSSLLKFVTPDYITHFYHAAAQESHSRWVIHPKFTNPPRLQIASPEA